MSLASICNHSMLDRFMFDCGEGTQRLCTEHKVRLQKVEGIFFTETRTETIFGLPGTARIRVACECYSNLR